MVSNRQKKVGRTKKVYNSIKVAEKFWIITNNWPFISTKSSSNKTAHKFQTSSSPFAAANINTLELKVPFKKLQKKYEKSQVSFSNTTFRWKKKELKYWECYIKLPEHLICSSN